MNSKHNKSILKCLYILFFLCIIDFSATARQVKIARELPVIRINPALTVHFVSPENLSYADISTHAVTGDIPVKNVFRIRLNPDSMKRFYGLPAPLGVLTIVGESFIAQYHLAYDPVSPLFELPALIDILPEHLSALDVPGMSLSSREMKNHALSILNSSRRQVLRRVKNYGVSAELNGIYTVGDYVFMDITYSNNTNIPYGIDELRFKVEDRKINKATNVQSVEIKPVWQLYPLGAFKKIYRNVYVLKKLTFSQDKVLSIELTERQFSGRSLALKVRYGDVLRADTF